MKNKKSLLIISMIILVVLVLAVFLFQPKAPEYIDYGELMNRIEKGEVSAIIFTNDYNVNILYKDDANITLDAFKKGKKASAISVVTNRNAFTLALENIYRENPELGELPLLNLNDPSKGSFLSNIIPILSFVLIIGLGVIMFMSLKGGKGGNNTMNFGKTKARVSSGSKIRFNDVAGADEEKDELKEIVEFLKAPKKFAALGARIPRGVLLVGPPGTGKTLFAKAVAGEANVPFFSISGSDFVEMFVGVGASRVRDLFAQAKKNMPCIVFIDEIDAVGRKRGAGMGGGNDEREQTLNQLLVQMDGFDANDGIIIIAATNRADVLDPALLRPGRFDRQIFVNIPDVRGREAIFKVHSRNKPIASDINFKNLARLTSGFSGADIENLLNESAILAARANRTIIIMTDLLEGINKVIAGPQKKSRLITETDKRITAYHEAGHAMVGRLMPNCDPIQEVSIIPRGMAAGYTMSRPDNDNNHVTKSRLLDEIAMMLGGRAAEEIVIQDISTGASQDIKRATGIAHNMVCEWGMSELLPNVFFGGDQEVFIGRDYQTQTSYSEQVASVIDQEIRKFIDTNYVRALACLRDNEQILHNMVRLLFERETIYGDEVDMLMQGKSVEEVTTYINAKQVEQDKYNAKVVAGPMGNPSDLIVAEPVAKNSDINSDTIVKEPIATKSEFKPLDVTKLEVKPEIILENKPEVKTHDTVKIEKPLEEKAKEPKKDIKKDDQETDKK